MKKQLFILSSLCFLVTACENRPHEADRHHAPANATTNTKESDADRAITERIRQAVKNTDSISDDDDIKISTLNGVVTLKGKVENEKDRNEAARIARGVAGVRSVDNQLEIDRNK